MANRRMFSKDVIHSSKFLSMSHSAQALYFHIGLIADDDGYCEKLVVMRLTGGKPADLQTLISNKFVHQFNDHILLDLHFLRNNQIRKDRYKASEYAELYPVSDIGKPNGNQVTTKCLPSIDKYSIVKNIKYIVEYLNSTCGTSYKFETEKTKRLIRARLNEGFTIDDFKTVIDSKHKEWSVNPEMMQYLRPETLFGTKFESYLNQPKEKKRERGRL